MRRILFILFLFVSAISISAQENNKGKVSLTFNNERIIIPINSVMLRKENQIEVSIRSERNDDSIQQMVGFELVLKNLAANNKQQPTGFRLTVNNRNKKNSQFEEFNFDYSSEKQMAYYGFGNDIEKVSWNIYDLEFRIDIEEIVYLNDTIFIKGWFQGIFRSVNKKGEPRKEIVEIKDGKFEIII